MHTVGQVLKETREAKFYTLEEIEKATKIRKELLLALEKDDYSKLPPSTFVKGFIKNYAKFLGLDPGKLLAIFRREFPEEKHKPYVMEAFISPAEKSRFSFTPGRLLGLMVAIIILSFFTYLWMQYRTFVGAPTLTVSSPPDQMISEASVVEVSGKTEPEVKVLVNNQEIAVESDGSFKEQITLSSPANKINVTAISKFGQRTEVERMVYLKR